MHGIERRGGGERVLWAAIAIMQRTEPDVVSVVYSGATDASKEDIIAKVQVRRRAWLVERVAEGWA